MALIKHSSSKGSYSKVLEYYTQTHQRLPGTQHYVPVPDAHGLRQPRPRCRTIYINAAGKDAPLENWTTDCSRVNRRFGKNQAYQDIKTHEFILSFRAEDREKLRWEDLEAIARDFVRRYCAGHQALISIHRDTDNDHIHISINSLRTFPREAEEWMQKSERTGEVLPCEVRSGGKYQDSNALKRDRNDWMLQVCRKYELALEDCNKTADRRKAERHTASEQYLRHACLACAAQAYDAEHLRRLLLEKYGIALRVRGKTVSVQHPKAQKAVRLKRLGLTSEDLTRNFLTGDELSRYQALCRLGDMLEVPRSMTDETFRQMRNATMTHLQMIEYWRAYMEVKELFWQEYRLRKEALWEEYHARIQEILRRRPKAKYYPTVHDPDSWFDCFVAFLICPLLGLLLIPREDIAWKRQMEEESYEHLTYLLEIQEAKEKFRQQREFLAGTAQEMQSPTVSLEEEMQLLMILERRCQERLEREAHMPDWNIGR